MDTFLRLAQTQFVTLAVPLCVWRAEGSSSYHNEEIRGTSRNMAVLTDILTWTLLPKCSWQKQISWIPSLLKGLLWGWAWGSAGRALSVSCLLCRSSWVGVTVQHKPGVVTCAYDPRTLKVEARSENLSSSATQHVRDHPEIHESLSQKESCAHQSHQNIIPSDTSPWPWAVSLALPMNPPVALLYSGLHTLCLPTSHALLYLTFLPFPVLRSIYAVPSEYLGFLWVPRGQQFSCMPGFCSFGDNSPLVCHAFASQGLCIPLAHNRLSDDAQLEPASFRACLPWVQRHSLFSSSPESTVQLKAEKLLPT